jgi:hypothetical protein
MCFSQSKPVEDVNRLNWGVWFEFVAPKIPYTTDFTLTFAVQLPARKMLGNHSDPLSVHVKLDSCLHNVKRKLSNLSDTAGIPGFCNKYNETWFYMVKTAQESHIRIEQLTNNLYSLLPPLISPTRKRALLNIAPIFRGLFGFATQHDVETLQHNVREIAKSLGRNQDSFQNTERHLTAFVEISKHRMDKLASDMYKQSLLQLKMQETLVTDISEEIKFLNHMYLHIMELETATREITSNLINLIEAFELLHAGFISPYLITPRMLSDALSWLTVHIRRECSATNAHNVVHADVDHYYKHASFIAQTSASRVYISLKIPLSYYVTLFNLYRLRTFDQPLHNTTDHVIRLHNLPYSVAIRSDGGGSPYTTHYFLNEQEFSRVYSITSSSPVHVFLNKMTCALAIFMDNAKEIKRLCDYSILLDLAESSIIVLNANTLLLTHVPNYTVICGVKRQHASVSSRVSTVKHGCVNCIVKHDRHCVIEANGVTVRAMTFQDDPSVDPAKRHIFNAPLLNHFVSEEKLQMLRGNFQDIVVPDICLPPFKFARDMIRKMSAEDTKIAINLENAVRQVKEDELIVGRLSEHALLLDQYEDDSSFFGFFSSTFGIIITVESTVIALLVAFAVYTFIKMKKVNAMLLVLVNTRTARAETLFFDYSLEKSVALNGSVHNVIQNFWIENHHSVAIVHNCNTFGNCFDGIWLKGTLQTRLYKV